MKKVKLIYSLPPTTGLLLINNKPRKKSFLRKFLDFYQSSETEIFVQDESNKKYVFTVQYNV